MRTRPLASIGIGLCSLLVAGVACSDPEFPPDPNASADGGAGKVDDPSAPPSAPAGDGGAAPAPTPTQQQCKTEGWSCSQIGACSAQCGIDLSCVNACKSKGCKTAQTVFDKNMECAQAKCLGACLTGMSKGCDDCVKASCGAQAKACDSDACPKVCTTVPGTGAKSDAGGAAPSPSVDGGASQPTPTPTPTPTPSQPATASCSTIFECVKGCGMRIGPCVSDCRARGCAGTTAAWDALSTCADQQCVVDCLFPFVPTCTSCLTLKCGASWTSCAGAAC